MAQSRSLPHEGVQEPLEICEVAEEGKARLRQPSDSENAHLSTRVTLSGN